MSEPTEDLPVDEDEREAALMEALVSLSELAEEDPVEALDMFEALPEEVQGLSDFQLALASLLQQTDDLEGARAVLQGLVDADADDADAHHLLGDVLEDLGEPELATSHFLTTLRLDRQMAEDHVGAEIEELLDEALGHLKQALADLPEPWRKRLGGVPMVVERFPTEEMVQGGLDPRALGLFEGAVHGDEPGTGAIPEPTRIVLFAENLDLDFPEPEDFQEQVKLTLLHEIGHYFGLDEEELIKLGLE